MLSEVDIEYGIKTPTKVAEDIAWRSGGHLGLLSFLGSALLNLAAGPHDAALGASAMIVTEHAWWVAMSSPELLRSLDESPMVRSLLRNISLGPDCTPTTLAARDVVRKLSIAKDQRGVQLQTSHISQAIAMLLSDGVVIQCFANVGDAEAGEGDATMVDSDSEPPVPASAASMYRAYTSPGVAAFPASTDPLHTLAFRISAPLLAQQLLRTVGSFSGFYSSALASLQFSTVSLTDTRFDITRTLIECLPYFSAEGLSHPLGRLKNGAPCEFAYHAPLFTILAARASRQDVSVIFESRNSAHRTLRRLDIALVDGFRAGIELLVDSKKLSQHVETQAAAYAREQRLGMVLVVNFCSAPERIDLLYRAPPEVCIQNITLIHVLFNAEKRMMTPYVFDSAKDAYMASDPVPLCDCLTEAPASGRFESLQVYEARAVELALAARVSQAAGAAVDISALMARLSIAEAEAAGLRALLQGIARAP